MDRRFSPNRLPVLAAFLAAIVASPLAAQSSFAKGQKPFAAISSIFLKNDQRDSLVTLAKAQVGLQYKWGAVNPGTAFDCSGLVQWLLSNFDLDLPRTSREQALAGIEIPKDPDQLRPGDLLFFGRGKSVSHVGIYVGDGKFVHAANRKLGVIVQHVPTGSKAKTWWKGVRRMFSTGDELSEAISPVLQPAFRTAGS